MLVPPLGPVTKASCGAPVDEHSTRTPVLSEEFLFGRGDFAASLDREPRGLPRPPILAIAGRPGRTLTRGNSPGPPSPSPRPTADDRYAPTEQAEAFWTGFNLGLDREPARAPRASRRVRRAFGAGMFAGRRERERRLDVMCGSPEYAEFSGDITDRDVHPRGVC